MANWIETLKEAHGSFKDLRAISADPDPLQPLSARLLSDLHHISKHYNSTKILFNFQMAAIGLYFMLQGYRGTSALVRMNFNLMSLKFGLQDNMVVPP
jgi:hypothetical protein